MTYTTQELIQILEQELQATWKGERILLSSESRIDNPVIAKALGSEKMSKVFAYQDFRAQIHQYQRQHRVSGIVWRSCSFKGEVLHFPELHNQLIAVPGDKETLMSAKESVLAFWDQATQEMTFWLAGDQHQKKSPEWVRELAQEAEWTEIDAARTELYLGLCWGKPEECHYRWARPTSGCERIIAAVNEPSSIKVH